MPLIKREITPVYLSRGVVTPQGVSNELECVTNRTLTSIMKQIGSMAKYAEDIFGELYQEASVLFKRSHMLQERIDRLSVKVTQLDSTHDHETLEDFMGQTPYHNTFIGDQIILDTGTLPQALQETRAACEPVPPLERLNPYREDGKEALKFYTNPKYFFELWRQEMEKNITEDAKKKRKKRKRGKKNENKSGPRKVKTRKSEWEIQAKGKEFMEMKKTSRRSINRGNGNVPQGSDQNLNDNQLSASPDQPSDHRRHSNRPRTQAPPPPQGNNQTSVYENRTSAYDNRTSAYNNQTGVYQNQAEAYENRTSVHDNRTSTYENTNHGHHPSYPAPPPPPQMQPIPEHVYSNGEFPLPPEPNSLPMPPPPMSQGPPMSPGIPPPPPPPPPPPSASGPGQTIPLAPPGPPNPNIPAPPPPPPTGGLSQPMNGSIPTPPPPPPPGGISQPPPMSEPNKRASQMPSPPRQPDARSELLRAIQQGMNLKRVQVNQTKQNKPATPDSVEAILARRIAVQLSDTESEGSSGSSSGGEWSEDDD